ncbi:MAG TPA: ATP-binding protein [Caldimonas sp.]
MAIGDENWEHHRAQLERRETFHDLQTQRLDDEGRLCTVSVSGAPVYDEAGEFVGYRGVGRDITEQKEQERREALRHTVTRLLAESTSAQDVVSEAIRAVCETCAWPGGIFRRVDRSKDTARAEEFWATAGDAPTFDLLLRCDAPVDRDRTATQGGLSGHFNCEIRAGEQRFGELDFRFRGQAGVDAATLGVIRDLGQQIGQFIARRDAEANVRTERELLAQRVSERTLELSEAIRELEIAKVGAEDASRAKSDFLAAMSHEIRTPMNGVIGMIEVLAQSKLTEEQTDAMQTIRASAFSLLGLIDDILDFSKIEAGHLELERTPVALADLVEGVCDMLAPQAAAKGVDLRLYIAPDVPEYVLSDATRLRQMLNNLVGNAVKFSGGRPNVAGRVAVRVQLAAERPLRLVLGVVDNGIGIAAATLEHLFSPFTQAEASTTRRFGGTGLGLAICKRLVALMDGAIDVSSELGAGSTFTVTLPIEPVEGRAWRRYPDLSGLDCIVVSSPKLDDADMRAYLDHAGARVHMAAGVRAAARFASSLAEQLVVVIQHAGADIAAQRAQAPFGTNANVRHVLLGGRARAHTESSPHGVVALTDAGLRRSSFLRAVALAAGRESAAPERLQTPAPQASDRRIAPTIAEARAEGRLILVAEDDAVNQKVILKQLALLGHAAEMASNGAEALRLWLEGRHHLLLSDLHMPELDGYGLARSIRDAEGREPGPPRMPILALTANALHEEAGRVRAAGMDEYLTKPIQLAALGRALERWLPSPMLSPTAATKPGEFNTAAPDLPVDVSVLKRLVGDDADTVREFLAEFLQIARAQAAELIASCEAEDNRCVGMVAHKLKASSRSIGALTLGDLCAELENTSRAGGKAEIAHGRVGFERAMRAVDAYIVDILADQAA